MSRQEKVFIAGHNGMVGSSILRKLKQSSEFDIVTASSNELDLTIQSDVNDFFSSNNFTQVYLAAAKVGGILANHTYPAEFIYQNLMIQSNIINASYLHKVDKLLFLGSSCIYPKEAKQPIKESYLLTGSLELTNEPYAIAKIAGIKLCESYNRQYGTDYRSIMPTNLYGPNDNFHPTNSHVIPGLLVRFHEAKLQKKKEVMIWGSGKASREFLHVEDMASASIEVMNLERKFFNSLVNSQQSHINVGSGTEYKISELATLIADVTSYEGRISFDTTKPDGPPRKLMDSSILNNIGWSASYNLKDGLEDAYDWFLHNIT